MAMRSGCSSPGTDSARSGSATGKRSRRTVAFLRAINVGGHIVTMDVLRRHFVRAGCRDVETFIASGNLVFTARGARLASLERTLSRDLETALAFPVEVFLRTEAEVAAVPEASPFPAAEVAAAHALHVGFLHAPLAATARRSLHALNTTDDEFRTGGREVFWLRRQRESDGAPTNAVIERALGGPCTFRTVRTITRMVERFSLAEPRRILERGFGGGRSRSRKP